MNQKPRESYPCPECSRILRVDLANYGYTCDKCETTYAPEYLLHKYPRTNLLTANISVCKHCGENLKISHQDGSLFCSKCAIVTDLVSAKNIKKEKVGVIFDWEEIYKYKGTISAWMTERAKIIGGWLVRNEKVIHEDSSHTISESMVFVPDPDHLWKVE